MANQQQLNRIRRLEVHNGASLDLSPPRERGDRCLALTAVLCASTAEERRFFEILTSAWHDTEFNALYARLYARLGVHFDDLAPPSAPARLLAWADEWQRRSLEWLPPVRNWDADWLPNWLSPLQREAALSTTDAPQ